jgi:hypothetical protein
MLLYSDSVHRNFPTAELFQNIINEFKPLGYIDKMLIEQSIVRLMRETLALITSTSRKLGTPIELRNGKYYIKTDVEWANFVQTEGRWKVIQDDEMEKLISLCIEKMKIFPPDDVLVIASIN